MNTRSMACCRWLTLVVVLLCGGCASLQPTMTDEPQAAAPAAGELPAGEGWWYARFHIDWPDDEPVRWYMGTLIAGEVIAPVFDTHFADIYIWRVHRRAARDGGHIFSFIFYSTPQGAQRINAAISDNDVVQQLLDDGSLLRLELDDVTRITRPGIGDTSDQRWSEPVQQTWPAMIMGVSRMWLDLVSTLAAEQAAEDDLEKKYRRVQDDMTAIWRDDGHHALLHHINAVYAYQPLLMRY